MKNIEKIMLMAGIPLVLASCSVFQKKSTTNQESSIEVKKESVLPTDREDIVQPVSSVYTSA